jgi:hypothetical protein
MEQICSECNKTFSNKKGLLKHRRIIHDIYCKEKHRKRNESTCNYSCRYCEKEYKNSQIRWQHEKKCKIQNEIKQNNEILQNEILQNEILQNEIKKNELLQNKILQNELKYKDEIIKLQKKLLKCKRLDNKTFKAVNKILIERSLQNSNNTNSNNTNSHNTINNNTTYHICSLGNEQLVDFLTFQQKQQIMNSRLCSLEKIVEIAHCGEMNQFKNILITNLKDNYAYRYDDSKGYFITVSKNDLLDNVIINRVMDIEAIYDELKTANKIDEKTKKLIQDFIDKMENKDTPFYDNETKYDNFKSYKIDRIKILLYNNQDKITKDIAIMISNDDNNNNNTIIENIVL